MSETKNREENKDLEQVIATDSKVAYWDVYVLDQGHYGFTQCSNCRYQQQDDDPYGQCKGCGYEIQGIKPNYQNGNSDPERI